jgi:hypothetical protein
MPKKRTEYERAAADLRNPRASVEADLARLKGMSRSDLTRDDVRGPASPLGHGAHSRDERKGRSR